jgi:hypothetical protein
VDDAINIRVLAASRAIIVTIVDHMIMAIHGSNQSTPVGLLKTRERPEIIQFIVLVVHVV